MKQRIILCLTIVSACMAVPHGVFAQLLSSCDRWANISTNGYNVYNNIWGSGYGSQCITVNAYNNWYVDANHPNTSGIKSYPNVERQVNLNVDNMGQVSSTFGVSRPNGGSYSTTYDIWYNNYAYEVMLWMNYTGAVGPIASSYNCNGACPEATNVNVGGHTWNVYRGSNGSNAVFSFLRTSNTNSGTVDITTISQWIRNRGWFGNVNLHSIQLGFEITSTSGNQRYSVTNFSVTTGSSCNPTGITPYVQVNGGSWQQASSVTVNSGSSVRFGPQPVSGGSWSWSGCGTSGSSREQTITATNSCTATATYTNSCGAQSTQTFTINVNGSSGSRSVTVRARGTQGSEQIQLRAGSTTVGSWTLGTGMQNYSASTSASGNLTVHFTNDNGSRDVQVDYITVNGTTIQSENRQTNTGVWQNQCGGSYSEWLHCNGYIDYGSGSGARLAAPSESIVLQEGETFTLSAFPNPAEDKLTVTVPEEMKGGQLSLINTSGQILINDQISGPEYTMDVRHIPSGMYLINAANKTRRATMRVFKK